MDAVMYFSVRSVAYRQFGSLRFLISKNDYF
jgi:hypothetical protein